MSKKNKKQICAQYQVRYDELNKDGYWENNKLEDVDLPISYDSFDKGLHEDAAKLFMSKMKEQGRTVKVVKVFYC